MGYYIDIEPRNPDGLTIQELDQRFLDAGCDPSPAREEAPDIPEDKRELYAYQFWIDLGTLHLYTCEETGNPVGYVRISWSTDPEEFRQNLEAFLKTAELVNVTLLDGEIGAITPETLPAVVERFTKATGLIGGLLGGHLSPTPTQTGG